MRPATSLEAYLAKPEGSYVAGSTWLHLAWSRESFGTYFWGRPSVDDIRDFVGVIRTEMTPHAVPHTAYADLSKLEVIEPDVYGEFAAYAVSVRDLSATRIRAQSIVYGSGIVASIAAGFFTAHDASFPFRAFAESGDAASWLGISPETLAVWEALAASAQQGDPDLHALRDWLARSAPGATVTLAARELGLSARTLQRRLLDRGTTFRREHDEARLRLARARLDARDEKLASLAGDLGFASHQHFSDWFRRLTGATPSEYRAGKRHDP